MESKGNIMADPDLVRAFLREEAEILNGDPPYQGDDAYYPICDIPENTAATLRFLPDADHDNPWFWKERQTIRLPFNGIVGGTRDPVTVIVPCVEMFHDICPIMEETKPWWPDINGQPNPMKDLARKYYKSRSYIASGFVVLSPFQEAFVPENPIRRFILGSSALERIKAGMVDPAMENHPTDYLNGCDFRVRKTIKDANNSYETSEWAYPSRSLSNAERSAIDQYGLFDLKTFLGTRPDADGIVMIKAMFHASLASEPFDPAAYGGMYRAFRATSR